MQLLLCLCKIILLNCLYLAYYQSVLDFIKEVYYTSQGYVHVLDLKYSKKKTRHIVKLY